MREFRTVVKAFENLRCLRGELFFQLRNCFRDIVVILDDIGNSIVEAASHHYYLLNALLRELALHKPDKNDIFDFG